MTKQEWQAQLRIAEKEKAEIIREWDETYRRNVQSQENADKREELLPRMRELNEKIAIIEKQIKEAK